MKLKIAISAVAFAAAQSASASTLDLTFNGYESGFGVVSLDNVPVSTAGGETVFAAGGLNMTDSAGGVVSNFIAWCLDLGAALNSGEVVGYKVTDTPFQNGFDIGAAGMDRVEAVFNANYGSDVLASADTAAAFQLALWEVVYDEGYSIKTGIFEASSTAAIESLTAGYLTAAAGYQGGSVWDIAYLESTQANRTQNLGAAMLAPVPVPAAGAMMLVALGGFAALRRKKA